MIQPNPMDNLERYQGPVDCLLNGTWGFTEFGELPLIGQWATAIQSVPIAVHVCLEHECAVRLKEVLWRLSPLSPEIVKEGSIDVASLGGELMGLAEETAFTAIAGGIGLQVNQFASLLGSIVFYLSINSTLKRNLGSVAAILLTTIKVPCEKLYWKL